MASFNLAFDHSQQDLFNLATFEAALEHMKSANDSFCDNNLKNLVSTANPSLDLLLTAIAQGDLQQVQTCLEVKHHKKCHPLCDCDKCSEQSFNALRAKDDLRLITPLSLASWLGQPLIVELILSNKSFNFDIEDVDKHGRTALHLAAFNGHQNALLLLLNARANANAKDNLGNCPIHYTAGHGHESCTKALLYNAEHQGINLKISAQNSKGDSALHLASNRGFHKIVKLLLEYGASKEAKNHQGQTPSNVVHNSEIKKLFQ